MKQFISRKEEKRRANAVLANRNAIALREGGSIRAYIAPPNSGKLGGNRATRRRRLQGFAAMMQTGMGGCR